MAFGECVVRNQEMTVVVRMNQPHGLWERERAFERERDSSIPLDFRRVLRANGLEVIMHAGCVSYLMFGVTLLEDFLAAVW